MPRTQQIPVLIEPRPSASGLPSPLRLLTRANEAFPRATDSFTSEKGPFEYMNDACTRARQLTCPQSTSLFMHVIESNTVVCGTNTVALQMTSIQSHKISPVDTNSLNCAESITASAAPRGVPPREFPCGTVGLSRFGASARVPALSRRLMSHSPNVISPAPAPPPASSTATPIPPPTPPTGCTAPTSFSASSSASTSASSWSFCPGPMSGPTTAFSSITRTFPT